MAGFLAYDGPKYFYQAGSTTVALDAASGYLDISDTGADIAFPASGALVTEVVSGDANDAAAGTGARTVRVEGLDADFNYVSQDATLNGTTEVNLTTALRRALTIRVLTVGSGNENAGAIDLRLADNTVIYRMLATQNYSSFGSFCVPEGSQARLLRYGASINSADGTVPDVNVRLRVRQPDDNGVDTVISEVRDSLGLQSLGATHGERSFKDLRFRPRTDIFLEADTDLDNAIVHGFLEIEILQV